MKHIKIISIFSGNLNQRRGTPIRVNALVDALSNYHNIDLCVFSKTDIKKTKKYKQKKLRKSRIKNLIKVYKYIKQNKNNIIIGHTMTSVFYLFFLKILTKNKVILEMHGFIEEEAKLNNSINYFQYFFKKRLYKYFYKLPDLITTCSKTANKIISSNNKNTKTIFGGVNVDIFKPDKDPRENKDIIIGYAGNLRTYQGVDFLINSFQNLIKKNKKFKLKILTSEKTIPFNYLGLKKIEFFQNFKHKDVPKFLRSCDVLVIPRPDTKINRLSFPSKLPEKMAMGKAIVASRTSDMDKIIINKKTGLLYEPDNMNDFINCLLQLKNKKYREILGQNAREYVVNNLSWEKQGKIFYKEIIKLTN